MSAENDGMEKTKEVKAEFFKLGTETVIGIDADKYIILPCLNTHDISTKMTKIEQAKHAADKWAERNGYKLRWEMSADKRSVLCQLYDDHMHGRIKTDMELAEKAYDQGVASVDVRAVRVKAIDECEKLLEREHEVRLGVFDGAAWYLSLLDKFNELKKGGA